MLRVLRFGNPGNESEISAFSKSARELCREAFESNFLVCETSTSWTVPGIISRPRTAIAHLLSVRGTSDIRHIS